MRALSKLTIGLITSYCLSALPCNPERILSKYDLWRQKSCLRGANIWQKIIEVTDDQSAIGPGPLGPPYSQKGLDLLSSWGANYLNLSHPGIFSEKFPYGLEGRSQKNLDDLIAMAERANLFVVISFRTGPGRTEKALASDGTSKDHQIWKSKRAQDAWVEMWKATAQRYKNNPVVVGYDLMVEPNSNGAVLGIYDPEPFFAKYEKTLYNWYPLASRTAKAIREIDAKTPILIGGMNWSSVSWLATLPRWDIPGIVYLAHHYEPFVYTHQKPPLINLYPGIFDGDYDKVPDEVNKSFLKKLLAPLKAFQQSRLEPVAVNEFGAKRWEPGSDLFLRDLFEIFEEWGVSHALWHWESDFPGIDWDDFNFRHGIDPAIHTDVPNSSLEQQIRLVWGKNLVRPAQLRRRW